MSKPANPRMIGGFVLGAIALVVLGVIYFGGARWFAATQRYVMYFSGSVNGLRVGAPVTWRGVPIGQVEDINLLYETDKLKFFIEVIVEINSSESIAIGDGGSTVAPSDEIDKLIAKGLRAQLVQQSFVTGQLAVQVSMFPDTPAKLLGLNPDIKEVPTVPSTFAQIEESVTSIIAKLEAIDFTTVIKDLEAAAGALRDIVASPELKQALVDAQQVLAEMRVLVRDINERFGPLADDVTATVKTADGTFKAAERAITDIRGSLARAETLLTTADKVIRPGSPLHFELINALREVSGAARSLKTLAETLERNPDALLFGRRKPGGR